MGLKAHKNVVRVGGVFKVIVYELNHATLICAGVGASLTGASMYIFERGLVDYEIHTHVPTAYGKVTSFVGSAGPTAGYFLVTPEPSTALLLTLGLVMLAMQRRRSGRSLYT